MKKKYVFKPYSSRFPELFVKEKTRIAAVLKSGLCIEHVGSTAVPGLGGKGIIDIAISIEKKEMGTAIEQLAKLGYEFRPQYSTPDRAYLITHRPDLEEETRRYHVHLILKESSEWDQMLGFRDYLRAHPQEAQEYADLKEKAALEADQDGTLYKKLKDPMFKKVGQKIKKF